MARRLKLNLIPQSEIRKEGENSPTEEVLAVGKVQTEFFIPEVELNYSEDIAEGGPQIDHLVGRINKYVENIADDYFLLGLHLIALHKLLKQSNLNTDQVKSWYIENIDMPYSSAMQCKKVAEVYQDNPSLIGRYTASGAYLLSGCQSHEEREAIWNQARSGKEEPSVRDLRTVLKQRKEIELQQRNDALPPVPSEFLMDETSIYENLQYLLTQANLLIGEQDEEKRIKERQTLIASMKSLIHQMEQQT